MSRRPHHDPTGEVGTHASASRQFRKIFRELRDGLEGEEYEMLEYLVLGATLSEMADNLRMSVAQVKKLRDATLAKLRVQQQNMRVGEYRDLRIDNAIAAADWNDPGEHEIVGALRPINGGGGLTRQGGFRSFCPQCGRNVPPPLARGEWRGRGRTYCSNACRQRAYRRRRAAQRAVERLYE
ncbi:hypothetical protein [Nocardia brasiliensis]|uniref:hypothetical protein n=1 Tax=Nocardia brasiliensis TaxID=37326 RepID=UPI002454659D|nr:hypothetical protein [Nocardia brasiliensis]